jgi:hypothetical protein
LWACGDAELGRERFQHVLAGANPLPTHIHRLAGEHGRLASPSHPTARFQYDDASAGGIQCASGCQARKTRANDHHIRVLQHDLQTVQTVGYYRSFTPESSVH